MYKTIVTFIIALFAGGASAWAIPSSLPIDFRTTAWDPPTASTQETVGNITATAAYPPGSVLTWSLTAGIGINAPAIYALAPVDILNVTFANGSGNALTGAWVTSLFGGSLESGILQLVTTTGIDDLGFSGLDSSGNVYINFGGALNVLAAEFCEVNPLGQILGDQNYSVAGFTSVPDGGTTLTLLGIGLITLMAVSRRFAF